MKKQLTLLVASALLLTSCNNANSYVNKYNKKVGSSVSYADFMSKYADAVADLQSGEFWDLITAGTPKSTVAEVAYYYESDETYKYDKVDNTYKSYSLEVYNYEYDEKSDVGHATFSSDYTSSDTYGKKVVDKEHFTQTGEEYTSKNIQLDVSDAMYNTGSYTPADYVLNCIDEFCNYANNFTSATDMPGAKYYVNGTLYTVEINASAQELGIFNSSDKLSLKVQFNIDPNNLFFYNLEDFSKAKYNDGTCDIVINKEISLNYISIKTKDIKVKMPSLTKYFNEDLTVIS